MDTVKIGEFLKSLRKSKGYTQQDVAEALYVTQKSVSRWETGEGIPDINIISSVAEFYGVTVDEILKGQKNNIEKTNNLKEQTINLKNKSKIKLIKNSILSKQNIYFWVSIGLDLLFLILCIILFFVVSYSLGFIIANIGFIVSALVFIYGNIDIKKRIFDEDNEDLQEGLENVKLELASKRVFFFDILVGTIMLVYLLIGLSVTIHYDLFYISIAVLVICISYYIFMRGCIKNPSNKELLYKRLLVFIIILFILLTVFGFKASLTWTYDKYYVDGEMIYDGIKGTEIQLVFGFLSDTSKHINYIFRYMSISLYLVSIIGYIVMYKKKSIIGILVSSLIGLLGTLTIVFDIIPNKNNLSTDFWVLPTLSGIVLPILIILVLIYTFKQKKLLK
ncbi:MAG: helix-turn-helix transcriptional regulator [Acholeplasmatales bacterium]|nr:helix-turn-helix transcriptional regulator [Acholeplasmatales bacterium]